MNPHQVLHRLTVAQAADVAQRHPTTIHKALEAGELHGYQRVPRGRWQIKAACLDAWLDGIQCDHQVEVHARSA